MKLLRGAGAKARLQAAEREALRFLEKAPLGQPFYVVGASLEAAARFRGRLSRARGGSLGIFALSWQGWARQRGMPKLASAGREPWSRGERALWLRRCLRELLEEDPESLGPLGPIAGTEGLPRALEALVTELERSAIDAGSLPSHLARVWERFRLAEQTAGGASESKLFEQAAFEGWIPGPVVVLDVCPEGRAQLEQAARLGSWASGLCWVLPASDDASPLEEVLGKRFETLEEPQHTDLQRLRGLWAERALGQGLGGDASVRWYGAPGLERECLEVARNIQSAVDAGIGYAEQAVLLPSAGRYREPLGRALSRAGIAARFSQRRQVPDANGRAFLSLMRWLGLGRGDDLAAFVGSGSFAFPEGLEVPSGEVEEGFEAPAIDSELLADESWAWDDEAAQRMLLRRQGAQALGRDWERWVRRGCFSGDASRWKGHLEAAPENLRSFLTPLLERGFLGKASAPWQWWLGEAEAVAELALEEADGVLAVLASLRPLAEENVSFGELLEVLESRLCHRQEGALGEGVWIGDIESCRGHGFALVHLPGVSASVLPAKSRECVLLRDALREPLNEGRVWPLATASSRRLAEKRRYDLALGAGAQVVLSWPDWDEERSRPRRPSEYLLRTVAHLEGRRITLDELSRRGRGDGVSLAWAAPADSRSAIDAQEYDLAELRGLRESDVSGAAAYLGAENEHLQSALRSRYRRSRPGIAPDGFRLTQGLGESAEAAVSVSELQRFLACPYRSALHRFFQLRAWEAGEPVQGLDSRGRGDLMHEVLFRTFRRMQADGLWPLGQAQRELAEEMLEEEAAELFQLWEQRLAPTALGHWHVQRAEVLEDLRRILREIGESGWVPEAFELAFGQSIDEEQHDAASVSAPLDIGDGFQLRGAIDLVERRGGRLRVTDYKTGAVPKTHTSDMRMAGGLALQPIFYALALEALAPELGGGEVEGGRLWYCTRRGGMTERAVRLDGRSRALAAEVLRVHGRSLEMANFPAMPGTDACSRCEFERICGPKQKSWAARQKPWAALETLRREK